MKRKTYNNVIKASRLIMKKGYEQKEAQEMALRIFENMEQLKNGMSAEWFIEKIAPKNYFMFERMHDLQERHECEFDCGIDDVAIGSGTLKGFVFLREDLLEE